MALTPKTMVGPYEITAFIDAGGMGEVYRARDPRLGRDVAIKVLPTTFSCDPDRLRRFEQEARAAAALSHPNVINRHDVGHDGDTWYVVAELLEGRTLRRHLQRGTLLPRKAIEYASKSPVAWRRRTNGASCIEMSSLRTSSSLPTSARSFSTSRLPS